MRCANRLLGWLESSLLRLIRGLYDSVMQRLLSKGLTCRIHGVDDNGYRILNDLRRHHLKRVIYLPALLEAWREKLAKLRLDSDVGASVPPSARDALRRSLVAHAKTKGKASVEAVTVRKLPKKQRLFTVLKSPHIDKKSREQFFFTTYGVELSMQTHALSSLKLTETLARFYETGLNELHLTVRF